MFASAEIPSALYETKNLPVLTGILRGAEREALRVQPDGNLALTPHPHALGAALTHPLITTDFSESLLEFITPPTHSVEELFEQLEHIHLFANSQLDNEYLWTHSMPSKLVDDDQIPVAQYGNSNNAKMKTAYRVGLGHRYGRTMQTVAGVHYNFSLPNAFWALLHQQDHSLLDLQAYKNARYFDLIRNYRRHYWVLIYLFGASPAFNKDFVTNRDHNLQTTPDGESLYLPYATSLRMSDLGYQSKAQESLYVCYNDVDSYIKTLCCAITQEYPPYSDIGTKDDKGDVKQLNTSILQIENEFYSAIRPKRTAQAGETAIAALQNRGVEYIEVRCLDIDPESPVGINPMQVRFLDTFLLYCALSNSPATDTDEHQTILKNQKDIVNDGRNPDLMLSDFDGNALSVKQWGSQLIDAMMPVAKLLDESKNTHEHAESLAVQQEKFQSSAYTPSEKVLNAMLSSKTSFQDWALNKSRQHADFFASKPISHDQRHRFEAVTKESHRLKLMKDQGTDESFDTFLNRYYQQYKCSSAD